MRKWIAGSLALFMGIFLCFGAFAETVRLPRESRYSLTVPDGMERIEMGEDPAEPWFVLLSEQMGLDIYFFSYEKPEGLTLQEIAERVAGTYEDVAIYRISGLDMIVYRQIDPDDPPGKGMKCIGYALEEGNLLHEICFWYANQTAADRTAEIIESITDKE